MWGTCMTLCSTSELCQLGECSIITSTMPLSCSDACNACIVMHDCARALYIVWCTHVWMQTMCRCYVKYVRYMHAIVPHLWAVSARRMLHTSTCSDACNVCVVMHDCARVPVHGLLYTHVKVPRRIVAVVIRQCTSQISRKITFSIWGQICPTLNYFQRTRNVRIRIRAYS